MPDTTLRRTTISVLVDNEAGMLARVIGLFSGRGYNIDSLTVAPVDDERGRSRINIVTSGTEMVIEQIKAQLDRLVPVHRVADLTLRRPARRARDGADQGGRPRRESRRGAAHRRCVPRPRGGRHHESFVFETDRQHREAGCLHRADAPLGLAEVSRTGVAAIARAGHRTI